MSPTAEPIHDTHRRSPSARCLSTPRGTQTGHRPRMDAVAARILAGYQARWHYLAGAAALRAGRPPPYLRSRAARPEGQGLDGRAPFFRKEHHV